MKISNIFYIISFVSLAGCASDLLSPPSEYCPNLQAAELARARRDIPQAIHDYRGIIKANPECEKAYVGLGMSLLDGNSIDEAKNTFNKTIGLFPNSAGAYAGLGAVFLAIDQPENAISSYDRALQIDPRSAKAWNGHGIAKDMLGDHECAQANYRAAMEIDPNNPSYEANLALSMAIAGNVTESIHILERLSRCPNVTPRVRQNLALAYGLAGDMRMAKKVGRVDLSDDMVRNNVSYFEAIQQTKEFSGLISKNHDIPLDEARKWQERQ
ncbi:MAG: tetratricopeptide repeat protein [Alphaproteobacteria bacterium]|nr:tetratricopeptide repeat protein [Alphaproteobacteria bacterium]